MAQGRSRRRPQPRDSKFASSANRPAFTLIELLVVLAIVAEIIGIVQAPHIAGRWSESGGRQGQSDRSLRENVFTKSVNTGSGSDEKTVGDGPSSLRADP